MDDSSWLPLTLLSFILDHSLFGSRNGPHHIENVLLHLFTSLLMFWFLLRATGAAWPAAFAGLLFACTWNR
jgi:hypothetical protein